MRRYRWTLVIGAVLGCASLAGAQASISVGDEVVFSGGPSQKPRSIQTGFTLETGNMRLSGSDQAGDARSGKARRAAGGERTAAAAMATSSTDPAEPGTLADGTKLPKMQNCLRDEGIRETPRPPDLSALATNDLVMKTGDPNPLVRSGVAAAMADRAKSADRDVAKRTLEELVADSDPAVAQSALDAIARFGDPSTGPLAMKLVYDTNDQTAIAAIKAVGTLGYAAAIPELTKLADRDTGPVGQAARQVAGQLANPPSPAPSAAPQLTPRGP